MTRLMVWIGAVAGTATLIGQPLVPQPLAEMANAERAFAARAAATSVREAFLAWFAEDSVNFDGAEPSPARAGLLASPPSPPGLELAWEPRLGDVAGSGELGYLTGPYELRAPGRPAAHGAYFSIWKRQPDNTWKVLIDQGVGTPSAPAFAEGFVRSTARGSWRASSAPAPPLDAADAAFDEALGRDVSAGYAEWLHPEGRVMRSGRLPAVGPEGAALAAAVAGAVTAQPLHAETAESDDLGFTWGRLSTTTPDGTTPRGYYVRVWTRRSDGAWRVAVDVWSK